jgi:hypothetical protein
MGVVNAQIILKTAVDRLFAASVASSHLCQLLTCLKYVGRR